MKKRFDWIDVAVWLIVIFIVGAPVLAISLDAMGYQICGRSEAFAGWRVCKPLEFP